MRVRLRTRQGGRRIDLVLGLLLLAGVLTGLGANTIGVDWRLDLIQLHAAGALAIVLVAPWKYLVIRRGLRRPRRRMAVKSLSLTLATLVVVTVASGLIHSTGRLERVGPLTLMQIHVGAAVGALAAAGVTRDGWRSVEVRSVTGYARWFGAATLDMTEARRATR